MAAMERAGVASNRKIGQQFGCVGGAELEIEVSDQVKHCRCGKDLCTTCRATYTEANRFVSDWPMRALTLSPMPRVLTSLPMLPLPPLPPSLTPFSMALSAPLYSTVTLWRTLMEQARACNAAAVLY